MAELDKLGPTCQSCSMPLEKKDDYGTELDGSKSARYCHFCYKSGRFTEPDITMEQMIEKVIGIMMLEQVMPEDQVRHIARIIIPTLERWKKKPKRRG